MLKRSTRYQGAIIKDHHILLIRQLISSEGRFVWLFPGGGMERPVKLKNNAYKEK